MGMLIKEMLDINSFDLLTANLNPAMFRQENTGKAAKEFIRGVRSLELYPDYQRLIDQFEILQKKYPAIYGHRPHFIWQVGQTAFQLATLHLSDDDFWKSNLMKCQLGFITILFDDICDMGHDKVLLNNCILALKGQIGQEEKSLYQIFSDTWNAFQNAIQRAPNYELLKPALEDAYQKWIDSFEYGLWLEETSRINEKWERHLEIISHSGTIYLGGLLDLSFLPNFSLNQLPEVSQVFLNTQKMVQICNWLGSWEREFKQRDFTSGVFSMALEKHWIEENDLHDASLDVIKQKIENSPIEACLWEEWEKLRDQSLEIVKEIQLPALDGYVNNFSVIGFMQLASSGII